MTNEQILHKLYYINKNFDNANELYRKAKLENTPVPLKTIQEWLNKQATSQKVKTKIGKQQFLSIYSEDPYGFQIDLTFLPKLKSANNGNYVLFTAINITSRYAYAYYGKDKKMETVIDMLEKFKKNALVISTVTCDSGTEFTNELATDWFANENITTFFVVGDSHKLGIVNRFHRTLKDKLAKLFLSTDSYNWIDHINDIIKNYNNTVNRGIGCTPKEASKELVQSQIVSNARDHNDDLVKKNIDIHIGDRCRIKITKKLFDKTKQKYSNEVYTITKIKKNTVDVSDENYTLQNIKKKNIIIVNEVQNEKGNVSQKRVETEAKIERMLKKEGLDYEMKFI
jgi:nitrogen regulatory protein PII-like uncharacterized protein